MCLTIFYQFSRTHSTVHLIPQSHSTTTLSFNLNFSDKRSRMSPYLKTKALFRIDVNSALKSLRLSKFRSSTFNDRVILFSEPKFNLLDTCNTILAFASPINKLAYQENDFMHVDAMHVCFV